MCAATRTFRAACKEYKLLVKVENKSLPWTKLGQYCAVGPGEFFLLRVNFPVLCLMYRVKFYVVDCSTECHWVNLFMYEIGFFFYQWIGR